MNKNNAYAYLLLGAVILAGVGGFMFSDGIAGDEVSIPSVSSIEVTAYVTGENSDSMDGGEVVGETES